MPAAVNVFVIEATRKRERAAMGTFSSQSARPYVFSASTLSPRPIRTTPLKSWAAASGAR